MFYSVIMTMAGILAAAVLRGFTGFGFGLAAVPLLSLALPPATVVPLVVVLQVVVGLSGLREAVGECDWRAIRGLFPSLVLGVPIGFAVLSLVPADPVRLVIGVLIVISVAVMYRGVRLKPPPSGFVSFLVGLISGIINGLASMGGPPVVVYLLALGHSPARMRATSIVYFMLASCVAALPLALHGMIGGRTLLWAAACLPALFAGAHLGAWMFVRSPSHMHRRVALLSLSILALLLLGRVALD